MKHFAWFALALAAFSLLPGCGESDTEEGIVVASYKEQKLYLEELQELLPDNLSPEDSAKRAQETIQQWTTKQAVVDYALSLDESLGDRVEFKVNDYRQKLILHEYTSKIIADSLDSNISEADILAYYKEFKVDFISQDRHFQYFYLVISNQSDKEAVDLLEEGKIGELRSWANEHAKEYRLDSSYVGTNEINRISIGYYGDLKKASVGKLIRWNGVTRDEKLRYLFKMLNVVEPGDTLPIELVRNRIRQSLINERKIRLIESTESRIVKDAKANNFIQTY